MTTLRMANEAGGSRLVLCLATLAVLSLTLVGCASSATPASPSPLDSSARSERASPDTTPAASSPPSPQLSSGPPAEPEWEVTVFGDPGPFGFAHDVVQSPAGLVAVGVQYSGQFPILGPLPPHEGRIWTSASGGPWQDVTPSDTFTNVSLADVFTRPDGTLVALGQISEHTEESGPEGVYVVGFGAWESGDGRNWQPTPTGLPTEAAIWQIEAGERGYLARISPVGATHGSQLWFSADSRAWERVRTLIDGSIAIGAGDEGFVALGTQGPYGEPSTPFAIASADGREWFESSSPLPNGVDVAPLDGDWIAASYTSETRTAATPMATWFSTNGLDWAPHGELMLESHPLDDGTSCAEYPAGLVATDGWLVTSTSLSYPCSEGGFVIHGTQSVSRDGAAWSPLPFEVGAPGVSGSGSQVRAAATDDAYLVLVGQMNGQAAIWRLPLR